MEIAAAGLVAAAGQTVGLVVVAFVAVEEEEVECQPDTQELWQNVFCSCECLVHV